MKIILVTLCLAAALAAVDMTQLSDEEFADIYLMPFDEEEEAFVPFADETVGNVSEEVDWRVRNAKCIHPIRDQASCGSCWAFATSEVASDRYCIASGGKVDKVFSPQYLVDCDKYHANGCKGATTTDAIHWIKKHGIVTDSCYPYVSGET